MKRAQKCNPYLITLFHYRDKLTRQQFTTLRGLIFKGDEQGAMKGLAKIIRRASI